MTNKQTWEKDGVISAWYSIIGRAGGKSTSPAKRKASRENAKRATSVRLAKLGKVVES